MANSIDAAHIIQQIRKLDSKIHIATSEWSATERLIEIGGKAVNETLIAQFFNRQDQSPNYQRFYRAFKKRFQTSPGFAEVASYDATQLLVKAIEHQMQSGSQLVDILRTLPPIEGLQGPLSLNSFGEGVRNTYITEIIDGQYHVIDTF